ncbi:MAG: hypothetical protein JKX85_07335 [Phycisphaeraceae bacterium]|nr:hypothetical protein [Phycisphaeraceae bacterium]
MPLNPRPLYFLSYLLNVIKLARTDLHDSLEKQIAKRTEASKLQQQDERLNPRQTLVLHHLRHTSQTLIAIAQHQTQQGITYPTARTDLLRLTAWGYLTMEKQGKKLIFQLAN